jgi:hypothetical protein
LRNDKREQWETNAAQHMLCHNNNVERPFAVARAFNRLYPAITLYHLSHLSHSMVNGTHRPEHVFGRTSVKNRVNMKPPGIALIADPVLRLAVNKLCSVRTKKVGSVTLIVRNANRDAVIAKDLNRKQKAKDNFDEAIHLKSNRAEKRDKADYTALKQLTTDSLEVDVQLRARGGNKKARLAYLNEQFHARVSGRNPRIYPGLGNNFPSV